MKCLKCLEFGVPKVILKTPVTLSTLGTLDTPNFIS
jgi:hypothetical protein